MRSNLDRSGVCEYRILVRLIRGFCAPVLVSLLFGFTPVAYAAPPDPTWIGGYWDDDDLDNAVAFIASTCAVAAFYTVDAGPRWAPIARVELCEPNTPAPLRSVVSPRAPPAGFVPCSS